MFVRNFLYNFLIIIEPLVRHILNGKMRVLAYHKVSNIEKFERQIIYLKRHFNIISLRDLDKIINEGDNFLKNSLLITFDDGDLSNYLNAYPVLKRHNIPATFFVITNLIDSEEPFWWDEMEYLVDGKDGNKMVWESKKWKNEQRINYINQLRKKSIKCKLKTLQITKEQLKEMNNSGFVIGNHSHSHPMFNKSSQDELNYEMSESIQFLKHNNLDPYYFAYPNGNWDNNSEEILKKYNIKLAFLFDHKLSDLSNPLRISRIRVDSDLGLPEFKSKVSGLHSILYHKSLS